MRAPLLPTRGGPVGSPLAALAAVLVALCLSASAATAQTYAGVGTSIGTARPSGTWAGIHGPLAVATASGEYGFGRGYFTTARIGVGFGNEVRVDPLAGLRTDGGFVLGDISSRGERAAVDLRSRALRTSVQFGYHRPVGDLGLGLRASAGPLYQVSFIRIQDDPELTTSNLSDGLKRGYDRRAGGWGGIAEAGLQYTNERGTFRAFALVGYSVTASRPLNSTQFDLRAAAPAEGTDRAVNLHAGFTLGLWRGAGTGDSADEIYY